MDYCTTLNTYNLKCNSCQSQWCYKCNRPLNRGDKINSHIDRYCSEMVVREFYRENNIITVDVGYLIAEYCL